MRDNKGTATMTASPKVISLARMAELATELQRAGKRVVLTHGCFDLLHIGHIRYLEAARRFGDELFVTISPDRYVDKGPNRPAFPERLRAEALAALGAVRAVAVNEWPTAVELLRRLKPNVYVKGADFRSADADPTGKLQQEAAVCSELGVELRFTDDIVFSSTNLINRFFAGYPDELREYLGLFRRRHSLDRLIETLEAMRAVRVLVIGDTILDDYCYCTTLGAASKHPTIALQRQSTDSFPGGVLAIANHLAGFAGKVDMLTVVGPDRAEREWIQSRLSPAVRPFFLIDPTGQTMRKLRYFDSGSFTKLLEVYNTGSVSIPEAEQPACLERVRALAGESDLVLMADFGHGAVFPALRDLACGLDAFLAVNTQCNAGNRMMHTISQYRRCDYASITEDELRRDTHDRHTHLRTLAPRAAARFGARYFTATRGRQGVCVGMPDGSFIESPALTVKATDTVGAGDALLSVSSLAAYLGAPAEVVAFFGNVAGALATQTVGNSEPVTRASLEKFITALVK